jgi:toxin FitB
MNIMDSSAWLEVLVDGPNAGTFIDVIEGGELVVPSITILEVTKRARALGSDVAAKRIESHMRRFAIADLTADRASAASHVSAKYKLPLADSIIYACALEFKATVWTQDDDFRDLARVRFFPKAKSRK